jgi:hypothetical protein
MELVRKRGRLASMTTSLDHSAESPAADWRAVAELALFAASVVLSPFYTAAGGISLGHWFVPALCAFVLSLRRMPCTQQQKDLLWAGFAFAGWTLVVGACWALLLRSAQPLAPPLAYSGGALIVASAIMLGNRYGAHFSRFAFAAMAASILLQALWPIVEEPRMLRGQGCMYFENPNQLGLFAIIAGVVLALTSRSFASRWVLLCIAACVSVLAYFLRISLSRAAWAAALTAAALLPVLFGRRALIALAIVATLAIGALAYFSGSKPVTDMYNRLSRTGQGRFDSLEGRGYDRIRNHPHYLVLGAGEGDYTRFHSALPREMHSTIGTVLFCYGAVGLILFGLFIFRLGKGNARATAFALLPVLVYGSTHHALRSLHVWLLFAIIASLRPENLIEEGRADQAKRVSSSA